MKILIDTNVILDVLLNRTPWVSDSQLVWDANHRRTIQGCIVATTLTNLFYIARKQAGHAMALQCVVRCLAAFEVLPVERRVLMDATVLPGADYEDNVAIRCAVDYGVKVIVTRDVTDFAASPIRVATPSDFRQILAAGIVI